MMTNADLTIYNNRGVDKKTARKLYLKTQIKMCIRDSYTEDRWRVRG